MPNSIYNYFSDYSKSVAGFDQFHNEVINMPRPTFSEMPKIIKLLRSLSSYIILFGNDVLSKPLLAKDVYRHLFNNYRKNILPDSSYRNYQFESTFLNIDNTFERVYEDLGRRFRHYTELFTFFGIFKKVHKADGRVAKEAIFDIEFLEELILTDEIHLFDLFRNNLLDLNIKNNGHIESMQSVHIQDDADYRPARAIIMYMDAIGRRVTEFELSVLLGRVDNIQKENDILERAIKIGKELPKNQGAQIQYFFESLKWSSNSGVLFEYSSSQEPYFKFKTFLILMDTFGMISFDNSTCTAILTEYSKQILTDDISVEVADLQNLLQAIEEETESPNKLANIILRKRTDTITKAIKEDGVLLEKINIRNLKHPIIKKGKRVRNTFITELAKIKAGYLDEVTQKTTFEGKNGLNYVEAHHIIEFSGENGPDITENLICLGPQNHSLIHHGSENAVNDFYNTCKSRSVITFDRFKKICTTYRCLTKDHVKILLAKGLVSTIDAEELNELIDEYGVDPIFLHSLQYETEPDSLS